MNQTNKECRKRIKNAEPVDIQINGSPLFFHLSILSMMLHLFFQLLDNGAFPSHSGAAQWDVFHFSINLLLSRILFTRFPYIFFL